MGFTTSHKNVLHDATNCRFNRILYITITSGLCGSITTFSTWQMECNKSFLLQWDVSSTNAFSSYNGGRMLEWLVSLWIGVALPLMALHLGQHLATLSPYSNVANRSNTVNVRPLGQDISFQTLERLLILAAVVSNVLVIVIPVVIFPSLVHITYTAILGAAGAYVRFLLSRLNPWNKEFPLGTFVANISGTWILAAVTSLSKFHVEYNDIHVQSLLYGLSTGFCGCLTTISTFVNEIDALPILPSYRYGIVSTAIAQLGIIAIYDIFAFQTVPRSLVRGRGRGVDVCTAFRDSCGGLLREINCSSSHLLTNGNGNVACTADGDGVMDYSQVLGECTCGNWNVTARVLNSVVTVLAQTTTATATAAGTSSVWPTHVLPRLMTDPTLTFDPCITFQDTCLQYLERLHCPLVARTVTSCRRGGVLAYEGTCSCGRHHSVGKEITDVVVTTVFRRELQLQLHMGDLSSTKSFPVVFETLCRALLAYVQCPPQHSVVIGFRVPGDFSSWTGRCKCGRGFDVSAPLMALVVGSLTLTQHNDFDADMVSMQTKTESVSGFSEAPVRYCQSVDRVCTAALDAMNCPHSMRNTSSVSSSSCYNLTTQYLTDRHRLVEGSDVWFGQPTSCSCGSGTQLGELVRDTVVDGLLSMLTNYSKYKYFPPFVNPYTLMVASSAYKQLQ
eukprot:gene870-1694_t